MEPTSKHFSSRRLRLHYADWGNSDRPPVILIHGGLDHCRNWDWVARALRDEFHVLALDLAGHGDSEHAIGGFYALTDFVFDLAQFFAELGLERASLIGHSMGGGVCSLFAGAFPERVDRLILIEGLRPAMLGPEPVHERLRNWVAQTQDIERRAPRAYRSIDEAAQRMREANPALSAEQALHLTRHGLRQDADGGLRWKYDNYIRIRSPARLPQSEVRTLWSRVACPTLMIGGAASGRPDPSLNGWSALFSRGESIMVPDAGHWVHHDALATVVQSVRPFLSAP